MVGLAPTLNGLTVRCAALTLHDNGIGSPGTGCTYIQRVKAASPAIRRPVKKPLVKNPASYVLLMAQGLDGTQCKNRTYRDGRVKAVCLPGTPSIELARSKGFEPLSYGLEDRHSSR